MFKLFIISLFFINFTYANDSAKTAKNKFVDGKIIDSEKGIKIPKSLMSKIHDLFYLQMLSYDQVRTNASTKQQVVQELKRKFIDVSAFVYDDVKGQLFTPTKLTMPRGGGVVDISEVLPDVEKLWFRLKISLTAKELDDKIIKSKFLKVYFISNQKQRQIDFKSYGLGCEKFVDVTDYFNKIISKKGVILPFKDQKYISIIGGTFIFAYAKAENLYLGSLGIYDSRVRHLQCDLLKF